jgi:hypothetical protein
MPSQTSVIKVVAERDIAQRRVGELEEKLLTLRSFALELETSYQFYKMNREQLDIAEDVTLRVSESDLLYRVVRICDYIADEFGSV